MNRPRCRQCSAQLPNLVDTGSNIYLCDDCQTKAPRRDGLIDFTKLRRIIKPKPFVDEETGDILEDNPPLNKGGFFHIPEPNELWAQRGMNDRKNHKQT